MGGRIALGMGLRLVRRWVLFASISLGFFDIEVTVGIGATVEVEVKLGVKGVDCWLLIADGTSRLDL